MRRWKDYVGLSEIGLQVVAYIVFKTRGEKIYTYIGSGIYFFSVCICASPCAGGEQYLMSKLWRPLNFNDVGDDIVCPSACYTDTSAP